MIEDKRVFLEEGYKAPENKHENTIEERGHKAPAELKRGDKPPSTGSVVKPKSDN